MNHVSQRIYKLKGKVQPYSWGGTEFIPSLLGYKSTGSPAAEYWLGAHQSAPSELLDGNNLTRLDKLIAEHPGETIGEEVSTSYGRLPYLLKILDVREMLSIQVHPSKIAAEQEFAKENEAGIPLNDPARNYRDDNHKPELLAALSDFWLLHGFKAPDLLIEILRNTPELTAFVELFESGGYEGLYRHVMELPQEKVNSILQPLLDRIIPSYRDDKLNRSQEDFWAARAALTYNSENVDRGIFSIYLLNLVHLNRGEAIFQDAGILHAYLEGQNVEIMANSDNVLRGGLTRKHIDIAELMKNIKFEPVLPWIIYGTGEEEKVYKTPVNDFQLSVFNLEKGRNYSFRSTTADVLLVTQGTADVEAAGQLLHLGQGESAVIFQGETVRLWSGNTGEIFRASVPVDIP